MATALYHIATALDLMATALYHIATALDPMVTALDLKVCFDVQAPGGAGPDG